MATTVVLYDGDGSTTAFTYPFDSLSDTYVITSVEATATSTDVTGNFTVSLDYDLSTVTLSPAPAVGEQVTIKRVTSIADDVFSFPAGTVMKPSDLEFALKTNRDVAEEARDQAAAGPQGPQGPQGDAGPQGATGATGDTGSQGTPGNDGAAATVSVGTVTTGAPGTNVSINNVGTSSAAILDFTIPRGDAGQDGSGTGTVTSVATGGGLMGGPVTSSGTISHADTSTQVDITASANTYIDGLTFDDYGHVTAVTTSVVSTDYAATSHTHTINELTDVTITAAATGEVLRYDGANWVDDQLDYSDLSGIPDLTVIPDNPQTAAYILQASDAGKYVSITTGGVTVNSSTFTEGDVVTIYNNSAVDQTITKGTVTNLRLAGDGTDGNKTLAGYGICTLLCVGTEEFVIAGAGLTNV